MAMKRYSLRERTHAAYKLSDDVPSDVKARRLQELIDTWRTEVGEGWFVSVGYLFLKHERGVVLLHGEAKKQDQEERAGMGQSWAEKRKRSLVACQIVPLPNTQPNNSGVVVSGVLLISISIIISSTPHENHCYFIIPSLGTLTGYSPQPSHRGKSYSFQPYI
jgi:hypothetical protein